MNQRMQSKLFEKENIHSCHFRYNSSFGLHIHVLKSTDQTKYHQIYPDQNLIGMKFATTLSKLQLIVKKRVCQSSILHRIVRTSYCVTV